MNGFLYKYLISSSDDAVGIGTLVDVILSGKIESLREVDYRGYQYVMDIHGNVWFFYDYREME